VTTYRQAWLGRAGVVVALAAATLFILPGSPASAAPPQVTIRSLSSATLNSGQQATLEYEIRNTNDLPPNQSSFNIRVTLNFGDVRCEGQCDFTDTIEPQESKRYTVTLIAGEVGTNQTSNGRVEIQAEVGGESGTAQRDISVRGPQEAPRVKEVAGKVTDISTGEPIEGATVAMSDSQDHRYDTTTNGNGNYRFTSTTDRPISPGDIRIGAIADGYETADPKKVTASAGQSVTVPRITLKSNVVPTQSPTVEPTVEPAAQPSDATEPTVPPVNAENLSNEDSGGGMGSYLLIIVGGLLVALGVGAIVLLLVRRKDGDAEEDEADAASGPGRAAAPVSQGAYHGAGGDPTRIAPRVGGMPDATMVTRPSLADAPTMLHNIPPITDEFPDPYGAPPRAAQSPGPQPPSYGGQQPGWGRPPAQPAYGSAGATSGYGAVPGPGGPAGGYGGVPSSGGPAGGYGAAPVPGIPGGPYSSAPSSGGGYGTAPSSGGPSGTFGNAPASGGPYGTPPVSGGPGGDTGAPGGRPAMDGYGGRDYGAPDPGGPGYDSSGYDDRYDEPTGRYDAGNDSDYRRSAPAYESSPYGSGSGPEQGAEGAPGRHGAEPSRGGGYGDQPPYGGPAQGAGGYAPPGGGYGGAGAAGGYGGQGAVDGYGAVDRGGYGGGSGQEYGQRYGAGSGGYNPATGSGYDQPGSQGYTTPGSPGYDQPGGGYDGRVPEQRGGYEPGVGYGHPPPYDPQPAGGESRHGSTPPTNRAERRSLDWLDD